MTKKTELLKKKRSKKSAKPEQNNNDIDTKFYRVSKVVSNKLAGKAIHYSIKWDRYKRRTLEPENRLYCNKKLTEFALKLLKPVNCSRINEQLNSLDERLSDPAFCTTVFDPLSIIGQTTVLCGRTKFVVGDTIGSKFMYLQHIRKHNQQFVLNSHWPDSFEKINGDHIRYRKQLNHRMLVFQEYPFVKIVYPVNCDIVFYSLPPLTNLIFEPITDCMIKNSDKYPQFFPKKSPEEALNNICPFIDPSFFQENEVKPGVEVVIKRKMKRTNYKTNSRFGVSFELRQEAGVGWSLTLPYKIEANVPLMMMCGVIRSWTEAYSSLKTEGEQVAFSSFIEIPGSEMCLDRREFYDFSKYIPHSCNPTCEVRLVESGTDNIPDLVIYSRVPINESNEYEISLDYFKGFEKDVDEYFAKTNTPDGKIFSLYEDNIDFVQCLCENKCREVLYIDRSTKIREKAATKEQKLGTLDQSFQFRGMSLAESSKVWKIENMNFVE